MKKLLYGILATLLLANIMVAQTTPLMTDGDYRIMMNDYTNNINTILQGECPAGVTIDQFKKNIVTGQSTLSSAAQTAITTFALPLKTYGQQLIAGNPSLQASNDGYLYFFASFVPSTRIDNSYYPGSLLESDVNGGLKATEMWDCAMQSFNVENCATQTVVQDTKDLNKLASYCVKKLTPNAGVVGVEVMLSGFSICISIIHNDNFIKFIDSSFEIENQIDMTTIFEINKTPNDQWTPDTYLKAALAIGFKTTEDFNLYLGNRQTEIMNLENEYNLSSINPKLFENFPYIYLSNNSNNNISKIALSCRAKYLIGFGAACGGAVIGHLACGGADVATWGTTAFWCHAGISWALATALTANEIAYQDCLAANP